MNKINEAINSIKTIECPAGNLESRVIEVLVGHGIAKKESINITRDEYLNKGTAKAYKVRMADENQTLVILAESGYDDYVANVVDVYSIK